GRSPITNRRSTLVTPQRICTLPLAVQDITSFMPEQRVVWFEGQPSFNTDERFVKITFLHRNHGQLIPSFRIGFGDPFIEIPLRTFGADMGQEFFVIPACTNTCAK